MIQFFKTLTATHNALFRLIANIRAQQDQHAAILHQIQQHLGLPPPHTDIPRPLELIAPVEETIRVDVLPQACGLAFFTCFLTRSTRLAFLFVKN